MAVGRGNWSPELTVVGWTMPSSLMVFHVCLVNKLYRQQADTLQVIVRYLQDYITIVAQKHTIS